MKNQLITIVLIVFSLNAAVAQGHWFGIKPEYSFSLKKSVPIQNIRLNLEFGKYGEKSAFDFRYGFFGEYDLKSDSSNYKAGAGLYLEGHYNFARRYKFAFGCNSAIGFGNKVGLSHVSPYCSFIMRLNDLIYLEPIKIEYNFNSSRSYPSYTLGLLFQLN